MIKLVKNELYKIFHKKSTYITLIIGFMFLILVNFIYNQDLESTMENFTADLMTSIDEEGETPTEKAELATEKAVYENIKKYPEAWQKEAIYNEYYMAINAYYNAYYLKTDEDLTMLEANAQDILNKVESGDWQYFINLKINDLQEELTSTKSLVTTSEKEKREQQKDIAIMEKQIELYNYALANNIKNDGNYLAKALNSMIEDYSYVVDYNYEENENNKKEYESNVKDYYENEYILKEKVDTNNDHTMRMVIENLLNEMEIIVLVFIIMIAGGMVSEEFNKGTIKNLLTIPYSRGKIITAKLLACLIMIPFILIFILLAEFIVGGLFFGYSSLSIPVVSYVVSSNNYVVMNVISYYFLTCLCKLPMFILLTMLAFAISNLILNTAFAITITFLGYIGSGIINLLALNYNIKLINYFVTPNWDLTALLFGGTSPYGLSLTHSLIVCFVYFVIMYFVTLIVFKRRNIKNI